MNRMLSGVVLAMVMLGGCGAGEPDTSVVHNESDIVEHIDAKDDGSGTDTYLAYVDGTECEIAVVMTDANMVAMYADAGDTVATNEGKTAGVKITSPEAATCKDALDQALSDFE